MDDSPVATRPTRRSRTSTFAPILAVGLACWLAAARDPSRGSDPPRTSRTEAQGPTSRPMAIPTTGGTARFTVPTPGRGSRTLVIVSSLATTPGTFPIRLTARPAEPAGVRPSPVFERVPVAPRPRTSPLPPIGPEVTRRPPRDRAFHLMVREGDVASASNYEAVPATLRAVGRRVQVYVDRADDSAVAPELVAEIVRTFDDRVFPLAATTFGQARDVDGDGRFTVFLSSRLTRLGGGRLAVDGFVRGADLDPSYPSPFSNHCDMMYLSTALSVGPHLRTVIAHEYTHAVTFSVRADQGPGTEEEGWLDEALAHLVEDLHGFSRSNLDYRVSAFLSQPERYRLVVEDYYAADLFRSHGNRGATYLFLRWCVDQYGPGLIPALIRSNRRGVANVEAATGKPFAELFREWSLANHISGLDPNGEPPGRFHSLTTRGPFGHWELAGPRSTDVTPGGPALSWNAEGTASRYVMVGSSSRGAVAIEVVAPESARLQVTALLLPEDLPRLELTVRPESRSDGLPALRAEVREALGRSVRLDSLSWEPLVPRPDPRAARFRHAGLARNDLERTFGGLVVPGGQALQSTLLPAAEALATAAPLVVKAVGTDARGRKVTAWADVPPVTRPWDSLSGPLPTPLPGRTDSN
ncbi:MAG: hypothetical protein AB7I30_00455 [Isosphaeraceae bacterium]